MLNQATPFAVSNKKKNGETRFFAVDEQLGAAFAAQLAVMLQTCAGHLRAVQAKKTVQGLIKGTMAIMEANDLGRLLMTIWNIGLQNTGAVHVSLFFKDPEWLQLWNEVTDVELLESSRSVEVVNISMADGLVPVVAGSGLTYNISDTRKDRRFNTALDGVSGVDVQNVLYMPLFSRSVKHQTAKGGDTTSTGHHKPIIPGVLRIMNKYRRDPAKSKQQNTDIAPAGVAVAGAPFRRIGAPPDDSYVTSAFTQEDIECLHALGCLTAVAMENSSMLSKKGHTHRVLNKGGSKVDDMLHRLGSLDTPKGWGMIHLDDPVYESGLDSARWPFTRSEAEAERVYKELKSNLEQ